MILDETIGYASATNFLMAPPDAASTLGSRVREGREAAGLSQPELASRIGMSQQGIAAIETDKVKRPKKLREIARAIGKSEDWLLGDQMPLNGGAIGKQWPDAPPASVTAAPNASFPPTYTSFPGQSIPLLGQTSAGANGRFILNGQEVGTVFCPPILDGVKGAYAVMVYGDSMEPKFEAGETVWLHPYLPVRRGDYVVAQILGENSDDVPSSYIKQFVSNSPTKLVLKQFNPAEGEAETLEFPRERVFSVHKIVFHQLV